MTARIINAFSFSPLFGRLSAWRERARTYAELSALDDRSLSDIGLTRGDIHSAARSVSDPRRAA